MMEEDVIYMLTEKERTDEVGSGRMKNEYSRRQVYMLPCDVEKDINTGK